MNRLKAAKNAEFWGGESRDGWERSRQPMEGARSWLIQAGCCPLLCHKAGSHRAPRYPSFLLYYVL